MKKDIVTEYSVLPSASPLDHFTPQQSIQNTNVGFERLEQSRTCNARVIKTSIGNLRAIGAPNNRGPYTLIMAVEIVFFNFFFVFIFVLENGIFSI